MTQREKYNLEFIKVILQSFPAEYDCSSTGTSNISIQLSSLFTTLDKHGAPLLDELNRAGSGGNYKEYYIADGIDRSNGSVQIVPPKVIINESAELPLSEFKLLVEEWVEFCKSNNL